MARTYNNQVQLDSGPRQAQQGQIASPYNFGMAQAEEKANTAEGLQQLGKAITKVSEPINTYLAYEYKKAKASVNHTFNKAEDEVREHVAKMQKLKGKDGMNVYDVSKQFMDETYRKYADTIDNNTMRELFDESFNSLRKEKLDRIMALELKNVDDFDKETKMAMNAGAIRDMELNYSDKEIIADREFVIESNTRNNYKEYGAATADMYAKKAVSDAHVNVANSLVAKSPTEALNYINNNWEKLDPGSREGIKKEVGTAAKKEQANAFALTLSRSGLSFEAQVKEIDKMKDPEQQALTRKLAEGYEKDKQDLKELAEKRSYETVFDQIAKDPWKTEVPLTFSSERQSMLYSFQERRKQDLKADAGLGDATKTNFKVWYKLTGLPQDELNKLDLGQYVKELSTADLKSLAGMQRDNKAYQKIQTPMQYANNFVKAETDDNDEASFLRAAFENALNNYPEGERTKLDTLNKVKDSLLLDMDVKGSFLDSKAWKVMYKNYQGKKVEVLSPAKVPDYVPTGSQWTSIGGQSGWLFTNPQGKKQLWTAKNTYYNIEE